MKALFIVLCLILLMMAFMSGAGIPMVIGFAIVFIPGIFFGGK